MSSLTSAVTEAHKPLPRQPDLRHIPGEEGYPFVGHTLMQLADPEGFTKRMHAKYGLVYRLRTFGRVQLAVLGPDANELVFFNRDQIFSSDLGWTPTLNLLFPRGLMMLDFEVHRSHRRLMGHAFKPAVMKSYVAGLNQGIAAAMDDWARRGTFTFYDAVKQLTLELAAAPFLGIPWGPEADKINRAFVDMVQASIAPVRRPLPFTQMKRGVDGRAYMCAYFAQEIPKRRGTDGQDMLTILCNAVDDEGKRYTDQEVIDHMNFLMMAAHDTITSSATSLVYELGRSPHWQSRLREEAMGLGNGNIAYEDLPKLSVTEMAFKEALRLHPPVPAIPRRAIKDFRFEGYDIPAGTFLGVNPLFTHRMEAYWPEPMRFQPERFKPEAIAGRHKYAWVPFGGGAHMCLGLHFAVMQSKLLIGHLLRRFEIVLPDGYEAQWQPWPIYKPKDRLPLRLEPLPQGPVLKAA